MTINSRRYPKVLADAADSALSQLSDLNHDAVMELLARYRRNRAKCIATWGVLETGKSVEDIEPVPTEYFLRIKQLDEAFQKLHHYRNGGVGDYVADDVVREISRQNAKRPRKPVNDYQRIGDFLHRRNYIASLNKKAIVAEAMTHLGVSESTIRRAIRILGIAGRGKKSTVT
jgi:hypothetical protein